MQKNKIKKRQKRQLKEPINRRLAQLMIEIQDEIKPLNQELLRTQKLKNSDLTKLIITETQECLNKTLAYIS